MTISLCRFSLIPDRKLVFRWYGGPLFPPAGSTSATDIDNPVLEAAIHDPAPSDQPEPPYLHYLAAAATDNLVIETDDNDSHVSTARFNLPPVPIIPSIPPVSGVDSDTSSDVPALRPSNRIFSVSEFSPIPLTRQYCDRWIPNYRIPSRRSPAQIAPWATTRITHKCVRMLDLYLLFCHFSKPRNFPFPLCRRGRAPSSGTWSSRLTAQPNVEALYTWSPRDSLNFSFFRYR